VQDDEFVYINERFADIFGRDQEALIGTSPRTLVCESDEGTLADLIGEGSCEEQFRRELAVERADGTEIPVEIQGGPVQYGGKPGCIGILWD
jgi:PAS domain S-box-containing protein